VMDEKDELYSVKGAAQWLKISKWTLYAWICQGRLPRVKLGSRCLIKKSDLLELIRKGERK